MSEAKSGATPPHSDDPQSAQTIIDDTLDSMQRKVTFGFAVALVCLGIVCVMSYLNVVRLREHAAWVEHSHEVLEGLQVVLAAATDCETAERGYVITGEDSYLQPYRQSLTLIDTRLTGLRQLTADNPAQRERVAAVASLVTSRLSELNTVIQLRTRRGFAAAQSEVLTGKGKEVHDQLRALVAQTSAVEVSLLNERAATTNRSVSYTKAVIVGGGLLALAIVGFALGAVRRDFAGRRRAEQALLDAKEQLESRVQQRTAQLEKAGESNARLASIIDSTDDAIASKNLHGIITSWNAGAERLFGYSAIEAVGRPMAILIPTERSDEETTILGRIARGETTDHFETVRIRKDGRKVDVSVTISPVRDGTGQIIGASKIARDITDRKVAELKQLAQLARLNLLQQITRAIGERQDIQSINQVVIRTLEEHLPVDFCCICLHDPAENVLIVSSIGARSADLALELAMTAQARVAVDQNGLARCLRGQLIYEPNVSEVPFPFPQRLAKGSLRAMVAAPLQVESTVFGVLICARQRAHSFSSGECEFLRQLSEHVALAAHQAQLYNALQQAYEDLRQTQKAMLQQERLLALGQMASGIAHDINNAISPVSLYTELLLQQEQGLSARGRGQLETIQRAIDDVARPVMRMREFYRQREPQLTLLPVDLNALVTQVVDLTRARWHDMAQQRSVSIEMRTELAPALPLIMGADNEIREALINLIFNAVDAMPVGGPLTLRTRVTQVQGAGSNEVTVRDRVQVEVIDSGVGMDEATRRRCLEPFFTTKGERGTGLGLAMVYGAMQRHSGDIEIDSTPGQGTTMRLSFAVPIMPAVGAVASTDRASVPPLRILLVDDDPMVLKSLADILESDGHSVTATNGGQAGIDAFLAAHAQGQTFAVVITDLGMPFVDGRKVSNAVKTAAPETIVVLLTGWGQRLVSDGEIPPHVDHVLSKPPKMRELRAALARSFAARSD